MVFSFPENQQLIVDGRGNHFSLKSNLIITHAHSDHFGTLPFANPTFATRETIDLFYSQMKSSVRRNFIPTAFHEELTFQPEIAGLQAEFLPSGHILGSASVFLKYHDKTILCSGDIGGRGLLTVKEPLEVKHTDILVVEATFGKPELTFQSREEIALAILKWSAEVIKDKQNVILSAGKIGSAQELIKLFNDFTKLRVITHGDVTPPSEIYRKYGVPLEFFDSKSEEGRELIRDGEVVIIQSRSKKIVPFYLKEHKNFKSAIVTGMASRFNFKDFDAAFPLSSHASYREILEYVDAVAPDIVFTLYGFEKQLAKAISRELGIPAQSLKGNSLEQNRLYAAQSKEKLTDLHTKTPRGSPAMDVSLPSSPATVRVKKDQTLDDFFKEKE